MSRMLDIRSILKHGDISGAAKAMALGSMRELTQQYAGSN